MVGTVMIGESKQYRNIHIKNKYWNCRNKEKQMQYKAFIFKNYITWLEMSSFVEDIEGVPLFSNLHLSEQPPEDSAQTSETQ